MVLQATILHCKAILGQGYEMNGALGHYAAFVRLYWAAGTTWADWMNFLMNHAPGRDNLV